ncbi:hypothetical protein ACFX12_013251 [Malus domestica]
MGSPPQNPNWVFDYCVIEDILVPGGELPSLDPPVFSLPDHSFAGSTAPSAVTNWAHQRGLQRNNMTSPIIVLKLSMSFWLFKSKLGFVHPGFRKIICIFDYGVLLAGGVGFDAMGETLNQICRVLWVRAEIANTEKRARAAAAIGEHITGGEALHITPSESPPTPPHQIPNLPSPLPPRPRDHIQIQQNNPAHSTQT